MSYKILTTKDVLRVVDFNMSEKEMLRLFYFLDHGNRDIGGKNETLS